MKQQNTGKDKIQQICDALRKEALEPAKKNAAEILAEAQAEAKRLILAAESEAERIVEKAQKEADQQRIVFQSSLTQAARQGIEFLRQEVEEKLFNPQLERLVVDETRDPNVIASILQAIIQGIEKQGLGGDLLAFIPKNITPQAINTLLVSDVRKRLKEGDIEVGNFNGGAKVRVTGRKMTIDISAEALKELLAKYMGSSLRKVVFEA